MTLEPNTDYLFISEERVRNVEQLFGEAIGG